jgi:hypothetical protein
LSTFEKNRLPHRDRYSSAVVVVAAVALELTVAGPVVVDGCEVNVVGPVVAAGRELLVVLDGEVVAAVAVVVAAAVLEIVVELMELSFQLQCRQPGIVQQPENRNFLIVFQYQFISFIHFRTMLVNK